MAQAEIPMKMDDRIQRLDSILDLNKRNILTHAGKVSHELAIKKAEIEYNTFKDRQKTIEKLESLYELEKDLKKLTNKGIK